MIPKPSKILKDNFDWQEATIKQIKQWVYAAKISPTEAFRAFDKDFDGLISKKDMKASLKEFIAIKPEDITDMKLDRLFKLMSFFKTEMIQQSDFVRIISNENPYLTTAKEKINQSFKNSMGGGLSNVSTHDWKFAAIQQIGLVISDKFSTVEQSFKVAAKNTDKVDFAKFSYFIINNECLRGFNMTEQL